MARGRTETEVFGLAFLTIAVCFIHFAVVDCWHADVVVISKCLKVDTSLAVFCGVVVIFAMVNFRNTLIKS